MNKVYKHLDIIFDSHKENDMDTWLAIVADEGKGKTNFELLILEYWYKLLYGEVKPEHIKHIALDKDLWKQDLGRLKKFEHNNYDEAGELTNRRTMSKFNVDITQFSRVVRGDNNFITLTIQDLFDLDPFFVKRRLKGVWFIPKKSHVCYWSQKRLRKLVAKNVIRKKYGKPINMFVERPTYDDYVPKYKGILYDEYVKMKTDFIKRSKAALLIDDVKKVENERDNIIFNLYNNGISSKDLANAVDISQRQVQNIVASVKKIHERE